MFFRKRDKVVLTLTPQEARYARSILLRWRNKLLNAGKPTEDVDELILKVIDAPTKKEKRKADREAR